MPSAIELFRSLREDLGPAALADLKAEVTAHYDRLVVAQRRNEFVAIDLAEVLCGRLQKLLTTAHQLEPDVRSQIVGAARYFISEADAVPDERSCTGLDDDVEVFNHVVNEIGRPDLVITE